MLAVVVVHDALAAEGFWLLALLAGADGVELDARTVGGTSLFALSLRL